MDDQQSPADHLDGQPTMRAAGARQPAPGGVANTPGAARGAGGPGLGGQGGAGNAPAASGVDGPVTESGLRTEEVLLPGADGPVLGQVDRYVLRRRLGAGGFGAVYLADDTVAQIPVALKTLPGQIANNPGELERMRENFALVQKLAHPHIASLKYLHRIDVVDAAAKDALRVLSGDYLLVMEYVAGSTLSDWRCLFPGRKVPLAESLRLCSQIASALDYAHAEKIVHRDIKPANIMVLGGLDADAQVKVLDFGLAAEIRSSMSRVSQEKGSLSGTPPYMSPEQWSGQRQGAASDQYSLAVLFYELISGDVPFASAFATGDPVVMGRVAEEKIPQPLAELTKRQNAALLRGLAKNPSERFASCGDFVVALGGERLAGARVARSRVAQSAGGRRGGSAALRVAAALVLLMALALGGGYAWRQQRETRARQVAAPAAVLAAADKALALDEDNVEAKALKEDAKSHQLRVPDGFRLAPGAGPEPYTNTGWAQAIIHEKSGIKLLYIPAGTFTMGSPEGEEDRCSDETQHQVTLSQGFYLGKTEVTQEQWEKVTGQNPSYFKNAGRTAPVENVSWDDCQDFCQAAGSGLRLPLEAEWEYACRAGTTTALYSGDITIVGQCNAPALDPIAWYSGNCGVTYEGGYDSSHWPEKQQDHKQAGTHPVGQKKPNAWGLYDMIGNVWEWCQDKFETYPAGPVTLAQPAGPTGRETDDGADRVLRGSSWDIYAGFCRSASRNGSGPDNSGNGGGLRVALSAPPVQ